MNPVCGRLGGAALLLLLVLATLSACSGRQTDPTLQDEAPVVIKPPGTPNEYLLAVGELEPGFGGFFFDEGRLHIYLLAADTATQAEKDRVVRSLVRVYGEGLLEQAQPPPTFLRGDYGMVDLYTWYGRLDKVFALEVTQGVEVSFTDLDEGRNRLAVGVLDAEMAPALQRGLSQLGIPVEAVLIEEESYACPGLGWFPILAEVRDAEGRPAARGATVTITKEGYEATSVGFGDPLQVYVGDSVGGTFNVSVSKPYHDGAEVKGIVVPTNDCGIGEPVTVELTLTLQPDAPPVRQVVVQPVDFGLGGGYTAQASAHVEADPGFSQAVVWTSEDERVATVSAEGLVTGVCRDTYGSTQVTATSVADPSKSDSFAVGVFPAVPEEGQCP